jgi:Icc-related predicted phosphoesterase
VWLKILVVSDLHLEFHEDGGKEFLRSLDPRATDVLVIAGDLCTVGMLYGVAKAICERFAHVVYVTGNHEYYGSSPDEVHRVLAAIEADRPGFHWLHETEVAIDGVRFGGTALWFRDDPQNELHAHQLNDFSQIQGFRRWVYQENARAVRFLMSRASALDVVVTHHLPARGSLDTRFAGSPLNRFFLCDVEGVISRAEPSLWIHGHTHASCDYRFGETRVVCNPAGYYCENVEFNPRLVVEVAAGRGGRP